MTPLRSACRSPLRSAIRTVEGLPAPLAYLPLANNLDIVGGTGTATFTRSTTGTYEVGGILKAAAIDEPRFEAEGVLIEGASTNLLRRSEEFTGNTWFANSASATENTTNSPDGLLTADTITEDNNTAGHGMQQTVTVTLSNTYAVSCFFKVKERTIGKIFGFGNGGDGVTFNLLTGEAQVNSTWLSASMFELSDGWWRCVGIVQPTSNGIGFFGMSESMSGANYLGDGTSGIFVWGAQIEELPFATSYIPTAAGTVTRTADNLSIDAGNIPAPTDDYSVTLRASILGILPTFQQRIFSVEGEVLRSLDASDNSNPFEPSLRLHGTGANAKGTTMSEGVLINFAAVKSSGTYSLFQNSVQSAGTLTTDPTGTKTAISLGKLFSGQYLFGHIKDFRTYSVALTANQVKSIGGSCAANK